MQALQEVIHDGVNHMQRSSRECARYSLESTSEIKSRSIQEVRNVFSPLELSTSTSSNPSWDESQAEANSKGQIMHLERLERHPQAMASTTISTPARLIQSHPELRCSGISITAEISVKQERPVNRQSNYSLCPIRSTFVLRYFSSSGPLVVPAPMSPTPALRSLHSA